ncbi:MAG: rhodanese-like domain-containing protein [Desulfobacterales bacterium]|jgi:3-mercaptopyruvate sulfurtransferase SseA
MRLKRTFWLPVLLTLLLAVGFGCAGTQKTTEPAKADWQFHDIVDVAFVQPYATMPQPKGVMIIDSRPYQPKFANGHIPTAISIPDSQFEKMIDKLPEDNSTLLIFYCEGPT